MSAIPSRDLRSIFLIGLLPCEILSSGNRSDRLLVDNRWNTTRIRSNLGSDFRNERLLLFEV